jgi:Mor family transcriptional regulator
MGIRKFTDEQEAEIAQRYLAGESSYLLAKAYVVSQCGIYGTLRRQGIKRRNNREAGGGLTDEQGAEVCARYKAGENTYQLGKAYGVSAVSISNILKRSSVKARSAKEGRGWIGDAREAEICFRYLSGETTRQLAKAFGLSQSTVSRVLQRQKIETRDSHLFGDSVRHALEGTGHHTQARECSLYLFELARYSATHCKPGIAFDADRRAASGVAQGEYGSEVLRLCFSTRAEAYFLEQAVLDATRGHRDCPEGLQGWDGASEVRAMPAEDLVPIIDRLAAELEEMGLWAFAAAHVPMTTAQRATCQQRAIACLVDHP